MNINRKAWSITATLTYKKVDDFIAELKSRKTPDSVQYHIDKINFHLKIILLFFMDIGILACSLIFLIQTILTR